MNSIIAVISVAYLRSRDGIWTSNWRGNVLRNIVIYGRVLGHG
jgi:hypothetical protein